MNTVTDLKAIILSVLALMLLGCQSNGINKADTQLNIAEHFVAAYNDHDTTGMLQWVHPEVRYMYVNKDQIYTETNGKDALAQFLGPFFQNKPQAKSGLIGSYQSGPFIHQVEEAMWTDENGQEKSQCSLSVYQTKESLIINIWYFSVFKCPEH